VRREGLALLPSTLANTGMLRTDRLLLPALASTAALGLYATVATVTELLAWPVQSYADARLGGWRAAADAGQLRTWRLLGRGALYALAAAPVLGALTYVLIVPVFGARYAGARSLVAPLVAAAALYGVSRVALAVLVARRRALLASGAEVCGFAVSVAGYLALIPGRGAAGAAYASLVGYGACLAFAAAALAWGRAR
jgi:O-antigen/teichoic acid export membrane protein